MGSVPSMLTICVEEMLLVVQASPRGLEEQVLGAGLWLKGTVHLLVDQKVFGPGSSCGEGQRMFIVKMPAASLVSSSICQ